MKAAGCEMVVLGTIIRETMGTIAESRKTGFNPVFIGSSAVYTDLIHKLGGKMMDGLYSTMTAQHPYLDDASQPLRFWANKYKTKFNEDPIGVLGLWLPASWTPSCARPSRWGRNLTTDSFIKAMDSHDHSAATCSAAPKLTFSATKRLGSELSRLSQIVEGRWKVISDYVAFSGLKPVMQKDGKWHVESEFFKDQ